MHRSGVWRLDQQLKKTGNLFHLLLLLFHLLRLNVSSEVSEKVSRTREKVKCQEAEEMVAVEEQAILLTAVADCPCIHICYYYCWLKTEKIRTYSCRENKSSGVWSCSGVFYSTEFLDVFILYKV